MAAPDRHATKHRRRIFPFLESTRTKWSGMSEGLSSFRCAPPADTSIIVQTWISFPSLPTIAADWRTSLRTSRLCSGRRAMAYCRSAGAEPLLASA